MTEEQLYQKQKDQLRKFNEWMYNTERLITWSLVIMAIAILASWYNK